jgi:hypothetical protein
VRKPSHPGNAVNAFDTSKKGGAAPENIIVGSREKYFGKQGRRCSTTTRLTDARQDNLRVIVRVPMRPGPVPLEYRAQHVVAFRVCGISEVHGRFVRSAMQLLQPSHLQSPFGTSTNLPRNMEFFSADLLGAPSPVNDERSIALAPPDEEKHHNDGSN